MSGLDDIQKVLLELGTTTIVSCPLHPMGIPGIWQQAEKLEAVSQDDFHKALTGRGAITIGVCPA